MSMLTMMTQWWWLQNVNIEGWEIWPGSALDFVVMVGEGEAIVYSSASWIWTFIQREFIEGGNFAGVAKLKGREGGERPDGALSSYLSSSHTSSLFMPLLLSYLSSPPFPPLCYFTFPSPLCLPCPVVRDATVRGPICPEPKKQLCFSACAQLLLFVLFLSFYLLLVFPHWLVFWLQSELGWIVGRLPLFFLFQGKKGEVCSQKFSLDYEIFFLQTGIHTRIFLGVIWLQSGGGLDCWRTSPFFVWQKNWHHLSSSLAPYLTSTCKIFWEHFKSVRLEFWLDQFSKCCPHGLNTSWERLCVKEKWKTLAFKPKTFS